MIVIDLSWVCEEDADQPLGIIVLHPTGIVYKQQAGGVACCHPSAEGFFVPLHPEWLPKERLWDEWREEYSHERVVAVLDSNQYLKRLFRPLTAEEQKEHPQVTGQFMEAWVPLVVREDLPEDPHFQTWPNDVPWNARVVQPLRGRVVVLTYPNSD